MALGGRAKWPHGHSVIIRTKVTEARFGPPGTDSPWGQTQPGVATLAPGHSLRVAPGRHVDARLLCGKGGRILGWGLRAWGLSQTQKGHSLQFSSVGLSCSIVSNSLQTHGLQHARLPCPSPRACSNSCPSSR